MSKNYTKFKSRFIPIVLFVIVFVIFFQIEKFQDFLAVNLIAQLLILGKAVQSDKNIYLYS